MLVGMHSEILEMIQNFNIEHLHHHHHQFLN